MTKYLQLEKEIQNVLKIRMEQASLRRFFKEGKLLNASNLHNLLDFIKQNKYGYLDFEDAHHGTISCKSTLWQKKQALAQDVTTQTLAYLQKGIGIKTTLPRIALQETINAFLLTETPVLAIVGEGGWGKSTIIAQWTNAYIQDNPQDIVYVLRTKDYEKHFFEYLPHLNPQNGEKFVIVLDALDEYTYSPDKIHNVANFFAKHYERCNNPAWLKVIFTSRPVVWEMYKKEFENQLAYQELKIGKLQDKEIMEIMVHNFMPSHNPFNIPVYLLEFLRIPLYLRFFIQLSTVEGQPIFIQNNFQLIAHFITYFVDTNEPEKREIIDFIMQSIDYFRNQNIGIEEKLLKKTFQIDEQKLNYHKHYQDLLNIGILKKVNIPQYGTLTKNYIDISHISILEYFVAEYILKNEKGIKCFNYLLKLYESIEFSTFRHNIMRLLLPSFYQKNDIETLEQFYELDLGAGFIYFWEINYALAYQYPEVAEKVWEIWVKNENAQSYFFEIFTNFKHITKGNLAQAWAHYQKHKTNLEARIFSHAVLLKTYLLKNDKKNAEKYYNELLKLEPDNTIHPYPIARRWAYMRQYEHWVGKEVVICLAKTDELAYQTQASLPTQIGQAQDIELYLFYESLICQTLNQVGKAEEVLKRIEIFTKKYPDFEKSSKKIILEAEKMIAEISLQKQSFDESLLEKVKGYYEQNLLWDIDELYLRLLLLSKNKTHYATAYKIATSIEFEFYENYTSTFIGNYPIKHS